MNPKHYFHLLSFMKDRLWFPAVFSITAVVFPFDGAISSSITALHLSKDLQGELKVLQQYGALSTMVVAMVLIGLLDPARRRSLFDWGTAVVVNSLARTVMKVTLGRPRPKFGDPMTFLEFWKMVAVPFMENGSMAQHAWSLAQHHPWRFWSMPSGHTAAAAVMSVFLVHWYPRLRPFGIGMVVLVGVCRIMLKEHYPTDVLVGAVLGGGIARHVITAGWGDRVKRLLSTLRGRVSRDSGVIDERL
jgi:membrane-associated phospholipid phosphatase